MIKPYYQDKYCTIYHGDCLEIMPQLAPVDLILTDPLYNVGKNYGKKSNDKRPPEEYWAWFKSVFSQAFSLMSEDGYLYSSHSDPGIYLAKPIFEEIGFKFIQNLIWWGPNGYSSQLHEKGWSWRHEIIQFFKKGDPEGLAVGKGIWFQTVIQALRPQKNYKEGRFHRAQKPVKLYSTILKRTPGDMILDPFVGSGTSLIAAKDLNRKAIGIEIEEKNCEIAAYRLAQQVMEMPLKELSQENIF